MLLLSLVSCSSGLEPVPAETKAAPTVTTTKKQEQKETKEETKEATIMQEYNPAEDDVINVLMIGNSFCYYYVEELYGIATAAGVNMKVCNLYYSGCKLSQHWNWWKADESNYHFFETDENGRKKYESFSVFCHIYMKAFISFQKYVKRMEEKQ